MHGIAWLAIREGHDLLSHLHDLGGWLQLNKSTSKVASHSEVTDPTSFHHGNAQRQHLVLWLHLHMRKQSSQFHDAGDLRGLVGLRRVSRQCTAFELDRNTN